MPTETFETPGTVDLRLRVPSGDIHITAVDEPRTVVEYKTQDADDRVTVRHREHGDRHEVSVEVDERRRLGFRLWGSDSVDVNVRVPLDSDVRVMSASGDLSIDGGVAVVDVKTASGDVRIDSMASGRLVSASGDIDIHTLGGEASLNTVSGDVTVGALDGDVTLRSVSGDVNIACAIAGDLAVRTVSGDVEIAVRRGSLVHVDAQALSGDLTSDVALDATTGEPDEDPGPELALRVVTVSGDVHVRRSNLEGVSM
jgi:DUF4097 and DUF4098 domain-containing protein YvlB